MKLVLQIRILMVLALMFAAVPSVASATNTCQVQTTQVDPISQNWEPNSLFITLPNSISASNSITVSFNFTTNGNNNYFDLVGFDNGNMDNVTGGPLVTGTNTKTYNPSSQVSEFQLYVYGTNTASSITNLSVTSLGCPAPPTVGSIVPASGTTSGGTTVTLTGTYFTGATAVSFGGTPASGFIVNSSTQITATAPAGSAGVVNVTVTTAAGTSSTGAANQYTYVTPPSLSPAAGALAAGTTGSAYSVTLSASGGSSPYSYAVTAGALPAGLALNTSTGVLSGTPSVAGTSNFTVTVTDGFSATASSAYSIAVQAAVPTITAVSPSSGSSAGGTTITITGTNFNSISGTPTVEIGSGNCGYPLATNVVRVSDTQITATVPAMQYGCLGQGNTVRILYTPASLANAWTYVAPLTTQTITFTNPGAQNFGTTPTLSATATSALTVSFTSSTTGVCTITSNGALTFITAGTCTINADQAGNSSFSPATTVSQSFSVNAVVPGTPTIGTATAGDTQATITFTAPASNGGSAIMGYTVTSSPGGMTSTSNGSPITVTGLTNGVAYTFTVTATNTAGTSTASAASNSATPQSSQQQATVPAAPTNLTATAGDGSATISFTAGSDGGSPITNYKYSRDGGSSWWALSPVDTTSPITIPGLTNGATYAISILAVNSVGDGQPSLAVSVTPQAQSINNPPVNNSAYWFSSPSSVVPALTYQVIDGSTFMNNRMMSNTLERFRNDLSGGFAPPVLGGTGGFGGSGGFAPSGGSGGFGGFAPDDGSHVVQSTKGTNGLQISSLNLDADDNGGFFFSGMSYLSVANGWRRAGFAELNYRNSEDIGTSLSVNGRMSWERYTNETTMYGYFLGADVQRANIYGNLPGRQNTWSVMGGAYLVARAQNGLIGSAYGGVGLNLNDLDMNDGTIQVTDNYGSNSVLMGASLSADLDRQGYVLRPSLSANFGQTDIGDLSLTQTTGGISTILPVSGGKVNFFSLVVEPEFIFKIGSSTSGTSLSELNFAPRLTCERHEVVTSTRECGAGLSLGINRASSDGTTMMNAGVSFDRIGGQDRSAAKLQLQMSF